jgi:hypothetical protein
MSYGGKNVLIFVGCCTLKVSVSNSPSERKCRVVDCTANNNALCTHIYILLNYWFIDCKYIFSLVLIFLLRNFIFSMWLTFVFYVPEDGSMVARNTWQFIVWIYPILVYLSPLVVVIIVHIRLMHR